MYKTFEVQTPCTDTLGGLGRERGRVRDYRPELITFYQKNLCNQKEQYFYKRRSRMNDKKKQIKYWFKSLFLDVKRDEEEEN